MNTKQSAAHSHTFRHHSSWADHVTCSLCGWATGKGAVLSSSLVKDEQLSPELLLERKALAADVAAIRAQAAPVGIAEAVASAPVMDAIEIGAADAAVLLAADEALERNGLSPRFVKAGENLVTHYSRRDAAAGRVFLKSLLDDCPDDDGAEIPGQFQRSLALLVVEAGQRVRAWAGLPRVS